MTSAVSNRDHVLRHLLILGLNLSDVQLLRVMINMSAAGFMLFLCRRLADVQQHTLQMLLLH